MKPHEESQALLNRQASDWVEILKRGREEDRASFAQWLMESPRHVRDYLLMETLDAELAALESVPEHGLEESLPASEDVIALRERRAGAIAAGGRPRLRRWAYRSRRIALAAGLMLAIGAGWFVTRPFWGWTDLRTALGEQRSVELPDGSLVHLNTLSHVKVRLGSSARDVRLLAGEAVFKVHHDPARPFKVLTDHATIEAIGTQFDVSRRHDNTVVAVLEGRVRVQADRSSGSGRAADAQQTSAGSTDLASGEGIRVGRNGTMDRRGLPSVGDSVAWRQRRLIFHEETLGHIAAEFNRYNRVPQLRVGDEALRQRQYSGAFDADDPHALVEVLSQYADLAFDSTAEEILIRPRH